MLLSIITVNLNNAEGLMRTLHSVRNQTVFDQFEHIVIDGASSDGSIDVINEFKSDLVWISEKDSGVYEAMNKGVKLARGKYLLFLNSGDIFYDKSVVEDVLPYLDEEMPLVIGRILLGKTNEVTPIETELSFLSIYKSYIPHPASFIRKDLLEKRPYDQHLKICSDWKFFFETLILDGVDYRFIDRIISVFDQNGLSSTYGETVTDERLQVLREYLPERIISDYQTFTKWKEYDVSTYDRFFSQMKTIRLGRLAYTIDVSIFRIASLFLKRARFARSFPFIVPKKEKV